MSVVVDDACLLIQLTCPFVHKERYEWTRLPMSFRRCTLQTLSTRASTRPPPGDSSKRRHPVELRKTRLAPRVPLSNSPISGWSRAAIVGSASKEYLRRCRSLEATAFSSPPEFHMHCVIAREPAHVVSAKLRRKIVVTRSSTAAEVRPPRSFSDCFSLILYTRSLSRVYFRHSYWSKRTTNKTGLFTRV